MFITVEPRCMDVLLIWTLHYYGQFSLSLALTFSLNSTCLIWILHVFILDSLLCPWGKKAPTFSLNSTCLMWTVNADTFHGPLSVHINRVWLYLYWCAVCFLYEVVWGERKDLTHRFPYNEFILSRGSKMLSSCKKCIHNSTLFVNLMHLVIVFAREQCVLLFALGFKSCVESCT